MLQRLSEQPDAPQESTASESILAMRYYYNELREWREWLLESLDFFDRIALLAANSLQEHSWNDEHCTMREIALFYLKIVAQRSA